ncbi:hypothetical protein ASG94_04295 [Nocardioides sp. Soil805]|nr:hypothetical protein ASG94_04295 [Nocardioides sp. Soil805]
MALGYGGHHEWRDMSEYLVHLTDSLASLASIFRSGTVEARTAYGAVCKHEALRESQRVVCLSEIPLDHLSRLAEKHGSYGVAFRKTTLRDHGATPVWYLERGNPVQQHLFEMVREAAYRNQPDLKDALWQVTPFIDYPGVYRDREFKWEWEREWPVLGNLRFESEAVPFVFAPQSDHDDVRRRWSQMLSPSPLPVLLDAKWPLPLIQEVAEREEL